MGTKKKIVIVGGGPAGLAAALSLTDPGLHPDWPDQYEVTVLQLGWRAGGKGATGRRGEVVQDGDVWRLEGDARIEEHGIHLFGNMYTNAMRLLNTCLLELSALPGEPNTPIEDELVPSNYLQLADYFGREWHLTPQHLPYNDLEPWGPQDYPGPLVLMEEMLRLVKDLLEEAFGPLDVDTPEVHHTLHAAFDALLNHHHNHPALPDADDHADVLVELERARTLVHDEYQKAAASGDSRVARLRSVWCQIELYVTVARGVIADDIFGRGIDVIDDEEFMAWCVRHGMDEVAVNSNPVQLPAQMCFQFPHGDTTGAPTFSAAGYLWFVLRQVLACGQATYWFTRGTGDTVVAPFYRVAAERGVEFRFFQKVSHVRYDAGSKQIAQIDIDIQATTVDGLPYQPLAVMPDGTWAWPDKPIYGQLVQGEQLRAEDIDLESWWTPWQPVATQSLQVGVDFDEVIMATPLPCLPLMAPELVASASWAPAVEGMGSIATIAAQLWTDRTTEELGFPVLEGTDRVCGGAAVNPLGVADMTDVLAAENWSALGDAAPKGLLYLCGPMAHRGPWPPFDEVDTPEIETEWALATLVQWLRTATSVLPEAGTNPVAPDALDFDALWCPPDVVAVGQERIQAQYWRANIDPNERYVPSPPGTASLRPKAWESGAVNLALASDWIFTGINIGSFEGAVMSGFLAAFALTGSPLPADIPGYDFARPQPPGAPPPAP
jgi:uncharacterized protein with NAD-binding domain and iron-sulfur cluster